ncbi:hypothetical protein [uncultured Methanobrevibacter sp.]|uniref:hypothetical protein n=1 Tax=uncultured Methanobrevibacter sp. TaxID=253161 RepID=UPI0025DED871|nr:hypothetical protein [uncultured Methanobrevibacter sp.]
MNNTDFYLEFIIHPTANSDTAYINIGDPLNNLQIGDIYGNANCGLNFTGGTFYGKAISMNVDTKITVTRKGTNVILTVGGSSYSISNMNIICSTLKNVTINGEVMEKLIVYSI